MRSRARWPPPIVVDNVEVTVRAKSPWCRCRALLGVGTVVFEETKKAHLLHQTQQYTMQHVSEARNSDAREVKATA